MHVDVSQHRPVTTTSTVSLTLPGRPYFSIRPHSACKAAEADCPVSERVNGAVRDALAEDREDLATVRPAAAEPEMTCEERLDD